MKKTPTFFLLTLCLFTMGHNDALMAAKAIKKNDVQSVSKSAKATEEQGPSEILKKYGIDTAAKQALVIDMQSGTVLFEKNALDQMYPSSMTKIMTTYVLFDLISQGSLDLKTRFTVSENAWKTEGTRMFLPLGDTPTLEDLLRGIIIQSGNDACVTVAEGTMGTEENFVAVMNEKAKELGLKDTHFVNSHGLPHETQLTTCHDLAKLSMVLIEKFPDLYPIHAEKQFSYNKVSQGNRNPLLYKDMGCDGLKTGHTEAGGYGVVATTIQDGRRLLLVINGCKSMQERATESQKLLSWARNSFQTVKIYEAGQSIKVVPVVKGAQNDVAVTVEKDVVATLSKQVGKTYQAALNLKTPLEAPIKKGEKVGELELILPDQSVKSIPVVAALNVEEAGFFKRITDSISYLLWGNTASSDKGNAS